MNLDSLFGGEQPYESKYFPFTYNTRCVPFDGCKLAIPTSDSKCPSLKKIATSLRSKTKMKWLVEFLYLMLLYFLNSVSE